ncbi:MAG: uridine kinase [Bacilli bacterium]|jgi:uridine kinase|nr:uridine kinase [Bacilli bacterium]MDY0064332.1 uridine kinase [Bacilli bacterium]
MKTVIIGIAGGTASGKTTIAKKLYHASEKYGSVAMIRIDDYYKRLDHLTLDERKKVNYDHPNAYDVDLLIAQIKQLQNFEPIQKPTYDFVIHNRSDVSEVVQPSNVIIIEGIMTFAIPELRALFDIKVFVDTPDDVRFIRRLKRDMEDRGRSLDSVIHQYLETVRPMHMMFVEPSKIYADLIVPEGGKNEVAIDVLVNKIVNILTKKE